MVATIRNVPFHHPKISELAIQYVKESVLSGNTRGSLNAPFGSKVARILENLVPGSSVFLTPSCTSALEVASLLMSLQPGDEVIMPAYNFTSSAVAVANYGAIPVFVDIDIDNLCINTDLIQSAITEKTRAISWVNYGGAVPNVTKLKQVAEKQGVYLVEDSAHGLGYHHEGIVLGASGDFSVTSFHETKNLQCGEGGALIINDPAYLDSARIIIEKGTNRWNFTKGVVANYEWIGLGASHLMADPLAAILLGQLSIHDENQKRRQSIYNQYYSGLKTWAQNNGVILPAYGRSNFQAAHLFYLICPTFEFRTNLQKHLEMSGVYSLTHYRNLATSSAGLRYGRVASNLEVTTKVVDGLLRIPLWEMEQEESDHVIESVTNFVP
jgi:dTDP-4-amino-4,6-dideoxygalactose transaminase